MVAAGAVADAQAPPSQPVPAAAAAGLDAGALSRLDEELRDLE